MQTERITSRQNQTLIHVKKLLSSRSYREKHRAFAADGVKLLKEAITWNAALELVIATTGVPVPPLPDGVRRVEVPEDVMASISLMEAPQGVLFVSRMSEEEPSLPGGRCLVLDGLQDPGNVGTIIRTADAMNVPVVLAEGCADLYNPKTVRASMGAVFRTRTCRADRAALLNHLRSVGLPLAVTALTDDARPIGEADLNAAVVIGSEGSGVCPELMAAADRRIIIPMNPHCESLNAAAAAAIVLWEMQR